MFPVLFSLCLVGITHVALADNARKCSYPGPLDNGEIHITDLNYLSVINFSCNNGFVLEGPTSSQCQVDGSWSARLPECEPVICPPPLVSEFGALSYRKIESGDQFVFQETISFSCLLPLALFGSETATCQADGSWTALPECKSVECPPPEPMEHGFINFALRGTFHYQDTVSYGCYPPYTMDEASESRCEKTGTWSNKPTCKAPCNIPVERATVLYNGQKINVEKIKSLQHAETIWFFCKSKTEKCSYKISTQCIDGELSVPGCFEEVSRFMSWFKKDPADMSPCGN
ncbi:beta-2-glycoprotein 1 [Pantherophis guttatus]|uniref:Beta-2-glycoprotein 1 n=1 Tax=Pantherophis guttatus TaxID=94885 RepID=A0A6P9BKI3_PANGU|nr:beta-2-glycoprotein 1 [Pantherophis guttatus]